MNSRQSLQNQCTQGVSMYTLLYKAGINVILEENHYRISMYTRHFNVYRVTIAYETTTAVFSYCDLSSVFVLQRFSFEDLAFTSI